MKKNYLSYLKKSVLLKNTLIVMITGFIVKALGMIGKILSTRLLGVDGMQLYVLSYPTILLFINLSGFGFNHTISKLTAEAIVSKKYSPIKLLKSAIKISLVLSLITIVIYVLSIRYISLNLLKNDKLFFPLLCAVILIPLTPISDCLRGYFNGLKQMKKASMSLLFEQLFRTLFSISLILILLPKGVLFASCGLVVSLSIGEVASIIYCLIKFKKEKIVSFNDTSSETKAILNMSIPITLSHLIGCIAFFLEPIVYLKVLQNNGFDISYLHITYTLIDAFVIPLLTFFAFLPFAVATALLPHIAQSYALKNKLELNNYLNRAFTFTFIVGLCSTFIMTYYGSELINFLFNQKKGGELVEHFALFFCFYYIVPILACALQATGKVKELFYISTFFNIFRILLIILFGYIKSVGALSVIYASFISLNLEVLVQYIVLFKTTDYIIKKTKYLKYAFLLSISILYFVITTKLKVFYLISCCIYILLITSISWVLFFRNKD